MIGNVEILAHISAPTTRKQDDQYRAEALAYLAFEPHNPKELGSKELGSEPGARSLGTIMPSEFTLEGPSVIEVQTQHAPLSRPTGSPKKKEMLLERKLTESNGSFSTGILSFEGRGQPVSEKSHSRISTDGAIADPANSLRAVGAFSPRESNVDWTLHSTRTAVSAFETQLIAPYSSSEPGDLNQLIPKSLNHPPALFRHGSPSPESNQSNIYSHGHASKPANINHLGPDGTKQVNFRTLVTEDEVLRFVSISTSEDSSSPAREIQVSIGIGLGVGQSRARRATGPKPRPQDASSVKSPNSIRPSIEDRSYRGIHRMNISTSEENYTFTSLPFEIFPPSAEVSTTKSAKWPSQSTPLLDSMKSNEGNIGRYKPKKSMRRLELDERGFWRVETARWPRQIQYRFWSSLAKCIQKGDFGWGITMHRETLALEDGSIDDDELGLVRLYCWGELVEHIYLFLWLYSAGRAANAGLQWIDADNIVVVQMP
ncbi:uncharacterized protein BDZ99DRAFT_573361 [Mytilinidion resinicola]|uniref:Uncharacterized protein n=1 Tax=Mytilinidion resinicola TaxID=574789 RepID=A0A6A6YFG4_9PEZI|nr:uncharacterized protein BDZ99DRAFT_573361 [Mytilinidion resinicola]KAF2806617.1 hypothetical protein BDZ99DRAFT_573361 [Mytilinidion resinicola]